MEVVPATPEDAGEIAGIYVDGCRDTYRGLVPAPYLEQLSVEGLTIDWRDALGSKAEQETVLVAREGSETVGFISAIPARPVSRGYATRSTWTPLTVVMVWVAVCSTHASTWSKRTDTNP